MLHSHNSTPLPQRRKGHIGWRTSVRSPLISSFAFFATLREIDKLDKKVACDEQ